MMNELKGRLRQLMERLVVMFWRRAAALYPGFLAYERTASNRRISVFVLEPAS